MIVIVIFNRYAYSLIVQAYRIRKGGTQIVVGRARCGAL